MTSEFNRIGEKRKRDVYKRQGIQQEVLLVEYFLGGGRITKKRNDIRIFSLTKKRNGISYIFFFRLETKNNLI